MPNVIEANVDQNVVTLISEGEVNQQVATARKYPRDEVAFAKDLARFVTSDEETAMDCVYTLPRAGKDVSGPSIRFAEMVGSVYGNSRYASRIVDEGAEFLTAQGLFHDLQRNIAVSINVQRRIVTAEGRRYGVDMIGVTANAAMSIALRNAILKGVPAILWKPSYAKAISIIAGNFETIGRRRTAALEHYKRLGVSEGLVLELLKVRRVEDIEPAHMVLLRGTLVAIRDGETTVERVFGSLPSQTRASDAPKADLRTKLDAAKASTAEPVKEQPEVSKPADQPKPQDQDEPSSRAQEEAEREARIALSAGKFQAMFAGAKSLDALDRAFAAIENETALQEMPQDVENRLQAAYDAAVARLTPKAAATQEAAQADQAASSTSDATEGQTAATGDANARADNTGPWRSAEDIPGIWKAPVVKFFGEAIKRYAAATNRSTFRDVTEHFEGVASMKPADVFAIYQEIRKQRAAELGFEIEEEAPPKASARDRL